MVLVPRLSAVLGCPPVGLVWEDTAVALPARHRGWRDVLTGMEWSSGTAQPVLVAELFQQLPFAVLAASE